jgi:hypothetical protein
LDRSSHSWECTASKLRLKVKFIFPLRKVLKTDHSFWLQISNKLGKEILRAQLPNQTSSQNHVLICFLTMHIGMTFSKYFGLISTN